jgi:dTDP-4-dehydrorhamnose reductase
MTTPVLITGSERGQLNFELCRSLPEDFAQLTLDERLDISDAAAVNNVVGELQPKIIINAAAYTAVDNAETDTESAFAVNHLGVENLAQAAKKHGAKVIHVSTDFVFGESDGKPFSTTASCHPDSVYGESKLAGEKALFKLLPDNSTIVRTAWVYSSHGNNFVKTMLRLMQERSELGIIADQIGSPTWAKSLAKALWQVARTNTTGMHHWTGAGVASWYDFAVAIYEEGRAMGLLSKDVVINPLTTEQYPTPAKRPAYSVLSLGQTWDALDIRADQWREELRNMMRELQ